MKSPTKSKTRLMRIVSIGTAFGMAVFAAAELKAQDTSHNVPLPSAPGNSAQISHRATDFLQEAAQANQTEIAMANVAEGASQNNAVKEMARMMRSDHEKNFAQVQGLAQSHLVALDSALSSANQHAVNRLQKTSSEGSSADFDKDYTKVMLKDHVNCITKFDKALGDIEELDIKEYAHNTLPTLRKHLRHAEDTARAVGLDEATISSILKGLPSEESQRAVTFNQN